LSDVGLWRRSIFFTRDVSPPLTRFIAKLKNRTFPLSASERIASLQVRPITPTLYGMRHTEIDGAHPREGLALNTHKHAVDLSEQKAAAN